MDKKIKDIYNCDYIDNSDRKLSSLERWYNRMIDKTVSELDKLDVVRMMRQDVFVELAIRRTLFFLQENLFGGELRDGEFFYEMSKLDNKYLTPYKKELGTLFDCAIKEKENHEWDLEHNRKRFEEIIPIFLKKFREMG